MGNHQNELEAGNEEHDDQIKKGIHCLFPKLKHLGLS